MLSGYARLHAAILARITIVNGSRQGRRHQSSAFPGDFPHSFRSPARGLVTSIFLVLVTFLGVPVRQAAQDQCTPPPVANGPQQKPPPSAVGPPDSVLS